MPCEQSADTRIYEVNADIAYRQNKDIAQHSSQQATVVYSVIANNHLIPHIHKNSLKMFFMLFLNCLSPFRIDIAYLNNDVIRIQMDVSYNYHMAIIRLQQLKMLVNVAFISKEDGFLVGCRSYMHQVIRMRTFAFSEGNITVFIFFSDDLPFIRLNI